MIVAKVAPAPRRGSLRARAATAVLTLGMMAPLAASTREPALLPSPSSPATARDELEGIEADGGVPIDSGGASITDGRPGDRVMVDASAARDPDRRPQTAGADHA